MVDVLRRSFDKQRQKLAITEATSIRGGLYVVVRCCCCCCYVLSTISHRLVLFLTPRMHASGLTRHSRGSSVGTGGKFEVVCWECAYAVPTGCVVLPGVGGGGDCCACDDGGSGGGDGSRAALKQLCVRCRRQLPQILVWFGGILRALELNLQPLGADLETVHRLDGRLGRCHVVERHETEALRQVRLLIDEYLRRDDVTERHKRRGQIGVGEFLRQVIDEQIATFRSFNLLPGGGSHRLRYRRGR